MWIERSDVQAAYPDPGGDDRPGFVGWCKVFGREQLEISDSLLPHDPLEDTIKSASTAPTTRARPRLTNLPLGVNVVGYLRSELGIGEIARQLIHAFDAGGVPTVPVGVSAPNSRQGHAFSASGTDHNPFAVNLICVNADGLPSFIEEVGPGFFDEKYNVGFWWWETEKFPPRDLGAFAYLDEVWVGSRFIADALLQVSPVPVVHVPIALDFPTAPRLEPGAMGLPEAFTFLFSYDYNSVVARKNPVGALEAYTRAFDAGDGTALVLKSINGHRFPSEHRHLLELAANRPDVVVLDEYLKQVEKDRLMASCDCYLSLHRSEGFGLTLAEAMFLGKPVIATDYSGNTDFMTTANSYQVRYRMTPIGAGAEPYPPDGMWAEPDLDHAVELLRRVRADPAEAVQRGAQAAADIRERYSPHASGHALRGRILQIERRLGKRESTSRNDLDELVARAGSPGTPSRFGKPGAASRKAALRAMKPYTSYQHEVNRAVTAQLAAVAETSENRLTQTMAEVMAELRRQRATLDHFQAALADPRPDAVRAVDARVDDLVGQLDTLRSSVAGHEMRLTAVGLGSETGTRLDLPVAPPDEPWSEAYTAAHHVFVATVLDDPVVLGDFRGTKQLPAGYGYGYDERVVEYPWLSAQRLGGRVLDAGSVLNHAHVLARLRPRMDDLHILTLEPEPEAFPQMHVSYVFADLRELPIADDTYDRVLSISTLEHVGMDNTYYGSEGGKARDPRPEMLRALSELRRVLKPGGDLYVTVPVGEPDRFEWVRALSPDEIDEIIDAFGGSFTSVAYYRHGARGWANVDRSGVAGARYRDHFSSGPVGSQRVVAAEAVACLHLVKPEKE